jgi:hypothetical protein
LYIRLRPDFLNIEKAEAFSEVYLAKKVKLQVIKVS